MLHSRVTGLRLRNSAAEISGLQLPKVLLSLVIDLLGPTGTLAMPTNAKYQRDALDGRFARDETLTYDPARAPCSVGLMNELFWRGGGVKRSLHPYNMLAARGLLADELLRNNLNERKPSAHGVDSGYYRFCQWNGLVISIGVPLRECLTLVNVVPEVRPNWPIKDFLVERRYRVVQGGVAKEWTVRLEHESYAKYCHCRRKLGRDLVAEGLIHEGAVGTVRVDWARAGEVYDFLWRKAEKRPYPYFALWLAKI